MFSRFFKKIKLRKMARQLRKPSGEAGIKTGLMMNKANAVLYDFTLDCMQLQNNERVLEIGFGNGYLFDKVLSRAAGLQLFGLDYSADMVRMAHEHNRELISKGFLSLTQGSSNSMPYPDGHFDKIFCINVVYFWDAPSPHLQEIKRVLKPGGQFFATVRSKESMAQMPFTQYGFTAYTPDSWKALIEANGLHWVTALVNDEPGMVFNDEVIQLKSYCLVIKKG